MEIVRDALEPNMVSEDRSVLYVAQTSADLGGDVLVVCDKEVGSNTLNGLVAYTVTIFGFWEVR